MFQPRKDINLVLLARLNQGKQDAASLSANSIPVEGKSSIRIKWMKDEELSAIKEGVLLCSPVIRPLHLTQ